MKPIDRVVASQGAARTTAPRRSPFAQFVAEQMAFVRGLRMQAMFGGYGVYQDDLIFAIIDDDRLFFRSDPTTRSEYEAKGLRPFTYIVRGKVVTMPYWEAPADVFEDSDAMRQWVEKAMSAAMGASRVAYRGVRKKRRVSGVRRLR